MTRRIVTIAVIAAVGLTGLWYLLLWSPQSKHLQQAHSSVAAAQQQQVSLGQQLSSLRRQQPQLPAKQAQLSRLKGAVPDTPQLDQLLDQLRVAESAAGVQLQSLTPTQPGPLSSGQASGSTASTTSVAAGGLQGITLTMQLTGSYFQVADFVNRLNALPRLIVLNNLSLSKAPAAAANNLSASVVARAFVEPTANAASQGSH
jgi:Tfp pilus assembly protein PilO